MFSDGHRVYLTMVASDFSASFKWCAKSVMVDESMICISFSSSQII